MLKKKLLVEPANSGYISIEKKEQKANDTEFNWIDRLKQWKNVQKAKGAIIGDKNDVQINTKSASMAILGVLQSQHKSMDIS